jgi:hypothetical protein
MDRPDMKPTATSGIRPSVRLARIALDLEDLLAQIQEAPAAAREIFFEVAWHHATAALEAHDEAVEELT